MKKSKLYIGLIFVIAIIAIIWLFIDEGATGKVMEVQVKEGAFKIDVTTTGELESKSSEKIYGPMGLRNFRIYQIKIEDIIDDGTVVDSGDYIAALDRTDLVNKMKDNELDLEQLETKQTKTMLDTTMELRTARDNLINLEYNLEEKQIIVDQSIYEPPATQRQAKIDFDKAQRNFEQAVENYQIKLSQAEADMKEVSTSLRKAQQEYNHMTQLLGQFTIYAPKSGMVIYRRNWEGQKQGIGSTVNVWDPVVAELPNLKEMISKTYVNEIDISKIKEGQSVELGVDAFPDKEYTGVVTSVANIGQQMPNSNAKVFEVIIGIHEYDSILRPAMTTKNEIITANIDSSLFLPLECVHANDSLSFVYRSGEKQQVILGPSNENEVIIRAGLEKGDWVYLVPPENPESYRLRTLDPEVVARFEEEKAGKQEEPESGEESLQDNKEKFRNMSPEERKKLRESGKSRGQGSGQKKSAPPRK